MRDGKTAALGAAIVLGLTACSAWACPVAADLEGPGIRFVGPDGSDEVHRRLDADRVEIDFITADEPGAGRSILIHGVYLSWLGSIDERGRLVSDSVAWFARLETPAELPVPVAGLTWTTTHVFSGFGSSLGAAMAYWDDSGAVEETIIVTVGDMTQWVLGDCTYRALPVEVETRAGDDTYTETITYLPDLRTGVLVGYADSAGTDVYTYNSVRVEGR